MILEIIVVTLIIATLFNIILYKFKMPTIIGYIATGTLISFIFSLKDIANNEELKMVSEFGIVFLMFTIGLEFSIKNLIKMKKNVFLFGSLQFFVISSIFYLISFFIFGFDPKTSIIIALGLTLSSTAIVLKILNENGDINKHYGNRSLGILLFQDLMVIPILLFITIISVDNTNIGLLLGKTVISAVVLFLILWLFGKYVLDYFLYRVARTRSNEIFIGSILFIIIGSSALAHLLGFTYSLGAFIAGVLIAETHYKHQVEADLIPFRDILLGVFFISVGIQIDFSIISENILFILLLIILLIPIKIGVLYFILKIFDNKKSVFKTALTLFQFGEFGIVVFELASNKGIISSEKGQILIIVIILSMIITPIVLKNISTITGLFFKNKQKDKTGDIINYKKNHTIIIGYGRLGKILSEFLDKSNINHIILEGDINTYKEAKSEGKNIIFGDALKANTLKKLNVVEAKNVIISIGKNKKLILISNIIKKINPKSNIIIKVNTFEEEKKLHIANIENIIVETERTAEAMIKRIKS